MLKRLRTCVMHASEPLTRDARGERSLSLDGVITAYRYVHQDDDGIRPAFTMCYLSLLTGSTYSRECDGTCKCSIVLLPSRPASSCQTCLCVHHTALPRTLQIRLDVA